MQDLPVAQLHAMIPKPLHRRLRQALAWDELTFVEWVCQRIEVYLKEVEQEQKRQDSEAQYAQTP